MSDAAESMTVRDELQKSLHVPISTDPRSMGGTLYGLTHFDQLFSARQLVAMVTFSVLVKDARERIWQDAMDCGYADDDVSLDDDGSGARAYAEAVSVYLALAVGRAADYWNAKTSWDSLTQRVNHLFSRQALAMNWDFGESNVFTPRTGSWDRIVMKSVLGVIDRFAVGPCGRVSRQCAQNEKVSLNKFVSTDPPYYDIVCFSDLSDFFYIWLRRSLRLVYPGMFAATATPKDEELVAAPYRYGGKRQAEQFFRDGMTQALRNLATLVHPSAPITIYYAFKQSEHKADGVSSRGWEAFLQALIDSKLSITAIWPIHCERPSRLSSLQVNSLSSAIVFVCRGRPEVAEVITRHQFIRLLDELMPRAIDRMTSLGGYPNEEVQEVSDWQQAEAEDQP